MHAAITNRSSTRRPPGIVAAYANEPSPQPYRDALTTQIAKIRRLAESDRLRIDRLVIEAGGRLSSRGIGARLKDLIDTAAREGITILIVSSLERLTGDPLNTDAALAALAEAGIIVRHAGGTRAGTETTKTPSRQSRFAAWLRDVGRRDRAPIPVARHDV